MVDGASSAQARANLIRNAIRDLTHARLTRSRNGVWQSDARDVWHASGFRDEVTLIPERLSHQRDCGSLSSCKLNSVTHGAGCATASMTVGSDDGLTVGHDIVEHFC